MTRAALVTGASRGLGRAVALELARRGCSRIGLGCRHDGERVRMVLQELEAEGTRACRLVGDLGAVGTGRRIVDEFLAFSGGELDLLVNNAGCFRAGALPRVSEEEWDRQVSVNLSGVFRTIRAALEALRLSRGAIVNVSSICGFRGAQGAGPYSAAKAGLEALTRSAALELGEQGIRVNAVIPGFLRETDMGAASDAGYVEAVLAQSPLGRTADVASAARVIADLGKLTAVTGQVISLESRVGRADMPRFFAG